MEITTDSNLLGSQLSSVAVILCVRTAFLGPPGHRSLARSLWGVRMRASALVGGWSLFGLDCTSAALRSLPQTFSWCNLETTVSDT